MSVRKKGPQPICGERETFMNEAMRREVNEAVSAGERALMSLRTIGAVENRRGKAPDCERYSADRECAETSARDELIGRKHIRGIGGKNNGQYAVGS